MGQRDSRVPVPSASGTVDVPVRSYPAAAEAPPVLILGHGAGAGHDSAFMVEFGAALAARGIEVATFNFPYIEQRRRVPDRNDVLEGCWREVIAWARERIGARRLFIGGKSMGGRIASQVAAEPGGAGLGLEGLVFLGYPLHPPGRPAQLRLAHWPLVRVPALFVQGSRDTFGLPEELRTHLPRWGAPATLLVVEDGDHSLKVRKSRTSRRQDDVYASVVERIVTWIQGSI